MKGFSVYDSSIDKTQRKKSDHAAKGEAIMTIKPLERRQLFTMKRTSLEKRVNAYYKESQHADNVIEYAVAIFVRNSLTLGGFSMMFPELIRSIYLTAKQSDILRTFLPYFRSYFQPNEWESVCTRLFTDKTHYRQLTKTAAAAIDYLVIDAPEQEPSDPGVTYNTHTVFRTSAGRKQTWVLKNTDPTKSADALSGLMTILTTLSIFESNGINRFAEFVAGDTYEVKHLGHFGEEKKESAGKAVKKATTKKAPVPANKAVEATPAPATTNVMEKEETYDAHRKKRALEKATLPPSPPSKAFIGNSSKEHLHKIADSPADPSVSVSDHAPLPASPDKTFFDKLLQMIKL